MRIVFMCAVSLMMFSGTGRAQSLSGSEFQAMREKGILAAEGKRIAELEKTPEGREVLAIERKEAKAKADAKDPLVQARLRAYKRKHRSVVAAKKEPAPVAAKKPPAPMVAGVMPVVSTFLTKHPEFGRPASVQPMPDWANGKRQRVSSSTGRKLLFYMQGDRAVTVYEDGPDGRAKVWGE
jgi:hypothetical protein